MAITREDPEREAQLCARVTATREIYNQAKLEAAALEKMSAELGVNHPGRRESMLHAARIERQALKEYGEARRAFQKFSLGKTSRKLDETEIAPGQTAFAAGSIAPNGSVPHCPVERPINLPS